MSFIYNIRQAIRGWMGRRRLRKLMRGETISLGGGVKLHLPPTPEPEYLDADWPPAGAPDTFGYATLAKPREGVQQNPELIETVGSMLQSMEYVDVYGHQVTTQLYRDGKKSHVVIQDLETGKMEVK